MRSKVVILMLLCLTIVFNACERNLTGIGGNGSLEWQKLSYEVEQRVSCFCPPPHNEFHTLTVVEDEVVLVDGEAPQDIHLQMFKTINELVELVENTNPDSVAMLRVTYDETYGYPNDIYIDYDVRIADEEIGYTTQNLRLLETE